MTKFNTVNKLTVLTFTLYTYFRDSICITCITHNYKKEPKMFNLQFKNPQLIYSKDKIQKI